MILVAKEPHQKFPISSNFSYEADHLHIVRDVAPEHLDALLAAGCTPVPRAIVRCAFTNRPPGGSEVPTAVHCFGCGAYIEKPAWRTRPEWFADGDMFDFVHHHRDHVDWIWNPPHGSPAREIDHVDLRVSFPETADPERPPLADGFSLVLPGVSA